ncbi:MAG TPA: AI-2E family transporter [Gaiellaceae bacterium]|nr:AI-2E family transporter [Gaiellaceae bacterium]
MVPEDRRVEERIVYFRPRAILVVLGIILAATAIIALFFLAWHVITWILVALFLTLALNPAVEFFQERGLRRSLASLLVFLMALIAFAGLGALLIPPLVDQIVEFIDAVPGFVDELTAGRGPLGFLQDEYQIVDRIEEAIEEQGAGGVLGVTNVGIAVARGVISFVVGVVTIAFLTIFMLLEGPKLLARFEDSLPENARPRWHRVSRDIYRTVGGYVGGNLLISLIAGIGAAIVLLAVGSSYAVALAVVVALLDLIPLAGATLAAIIVSTVTWIELGWVKALIVIIFFVLYQQLENHILQPVIYGRTVQLSPLTVLIAILIGAELIGILGALAAIPVAGIVQAVVREVVRWRRESIVATPGEVVLPDETGGGR